MPFEIQVQAGGLSYTVRAPSADSAISLGQQLQMLLAQIDSIDVRAEPIFPDISGADRAFGAVKIGELHPPRAEAYFPIAQEDGTNIGIAVRDNTPGFLVQTVVEGPWTHVVNGHPFYTKLKAANVLHSRRMDQRLIRDVFEHLNKP